MTTRAHKTLRRVRHDRRARMLAWARIVPLGRILQRPHEPIRVHVGTAY